MRLFRAIRRLIKPHVCWLFTKQWSIINIVKALPINYRVHFKMCMSDEGRIESFREISVSKLPCMILIRSIFVRGLSPSRLKVSPTRLEESLSGLKGSPLGLKESPTGLRDSKKVLRDSKKVLLDSKKVLLDSTKVLPDSKQVLRDSKKFPRDWKKTFPCVKEVWMKSFRRTKTLLF